MIMDSTKENTLLPDYSKEKIKVAFIGCGNIAYFHYDVLNALGINVIATAARSNSTNIVKFVSTYSAIVPYDNYKCMIKCEKPDAIFLLTSWDQTENILFDLAEYDIPILSEKPVALTPNKVESLINLYEKKKSKLLVGYNRRFYDFIPEIKRKLTNLNISAVEIHIPESSSGINDYNLLNNLFIQNSSHVIDIFYYLMNEPEIHIDKIKRALSPHNNKPAGYNAFLSSDDIPVHLIANWNSPSNFGIKFHSENFLVELLPLEVATLYNGFEIIEPSQNNPIRRYKPKVESQYYISEKSAKFKPGFLNQAINFIETSILCNYMNTQAATLESTLKITKACSSIINGEFI